MDDAVKKIRLGHVSVNEKSKRLVRDILDSGKIGQSYMIAKFENTFANWLKVRHCIATSSGTMADTVALAVLKHLNPTKTEVIVPALTFIAQVNSVVHNGLTPVFLDVLPHTLNMEPSTIPEKYTRKTLCVFPVHLLGRPCDMLGFNQVCAYLKLPMIEDACEAMGSEVNPGLSIFKKCGTFGEMGTFSFFPSHLLTTGEGGMICTNNDDLASLCRKFINHGKINKHTFHFDVIGFNAKMSGIQAAIGLGMMDDLDWIIQKRQLAFEKFGGKYDKFREKIIPHAFPFFSEDRDRQMEIFQENGIECRNLFSSIPTQESAYRYLGHKLGEFPVAEKIGETGFYVPCHHGLTENDIDKIKGLILEEAMI